MNRKGKGDHISVVLEYMIADESTKPDLEASLELSERINRNQTE
jgi:hypothetical protein